MSLSNLSIKDFLKKATGTAAHYGFEPIVALADQAKRLGKKSEPIPRLTNDQKRIDAVSGELTGALRQFFVHNLDHLEKPVRLFHTNISDDPKKPLPKKVVFGIHIMGTKKSIAEAMILQTVSSLMHELGSKASHVQINSMGDRDSLARFARELTAFLRKNIGMLSDRERQAFKEDVFTAFEFIAHPDHPLRHLSPRAVEFLSEASRRHLREVLEYLEHSDARYEMNDSLMGHQHCYSETLFRFAPKEEEDISYNHPNLAVFGGRYDELARRLFRKKMPAVGAVIEFEPQGLVKRSEEISLRFPNRKSQIYLVQLGPEAKLQSLLFLEEFRRARVPISQAIENDSLSSQLLQAEAIGVPFTVILGQKEVRERAAIVRDMRTRAQQSVPFDLLVQHVRGLNG